MKALLAVLAILIIIPTLGPAQAQTRTEQISESELALAVLAMPDELVEKMSALNSEVPKYKASCQTLFNEVRRIDRASKIGALTDNDKKRVLAAYIIWQAYLSKITVKMSEFRDTLKSEADKLDITQLRVVRLWTVDLLKEVTAASNMPPDVQAILDRGLNKELPVPKTTRH